jgi:ATP-binding cassette subfamily B protein
MAGAERVFEVIDSENEVDEGTKEINLDTFEGHIEFKNVYFSYVEGEPVLKNFSLKVDPGEKIALVGHTGSGKTTIVNLLMRFYDIDEGEILIDGVNIKEITKESLRNTISIVLQDTVLFIDSIANNIKYGKLDASFEEMKAAAILANVNFFVKKLPDRYDTMLTEGGSNLSQGQRQLLSISRAVLKDPKILILDEATSSVDTRTEKNIQDAMVNLMKNRTNLIIAHRLSTIQDADKIVVIDHGEILEIGNHNELLEKEGKYYELYMTQFAGKEI